MSYKKLIPFINGENELAANVVTMAEDYCFAGADELFLYNYSKITEEREEFLATLKEIDKKIDEVAAGWKTKRMGKVELTILRLAVYEMLYDDTIPEKVSVNEAVELAKKFGGNESPAFVNGVLAKFIPKEEKKEESKEDQEA